MCHVMWLGDELTLCSLLTATVQHQHWLIYRKWNEALFMEMYTAFKNGRSEKDPSESWYEGELGFFDFYIIPLATKLFKCGVLKVSDDEIVSYARQNREEWKEKGRDIVAQMKQKALDKHVDSDNHCLLYTSPSPRDRG